MSDVARQFLHALETPSPGDDWAESLLPNRLAQAAAQALPCDGAGISLFTNDVRVPLGASSADVVAAEQIQFDLGEGPCLESIRTQRAISCSADTLAERWPLLAQRLTERSPYTSQAAAPITAMASLRMALDLYYVDPQGGAAKLDPGITTICNCIVVELNGLPIPGEGGGLANKHGAEAAISRMHVWPAIGMIMGASGDAAPDALAQLRAYAYSNDLTVDAAAQALLTFTVRVQDLLDAE